jgi:hypothetical protein
MSNFWSSSDQDELDRLLKKRDADKLEQAKKAAILAQQRLANLPALPNVPKPILAPVNDSLEQFKLEQAKKDAILAQQRLANLPGPVPKPFIAGLYGGIYKK